jgi:hypothetical protein
LAVTAPSPTTREGPAVTTAALERVWTRAGALAARFFVPVDIAGLVLFRVAFGALMLWEVWRYFHYGWIAFYYVRPDFNFPYVGFEWVRPWPGNGMTYHFLALGFLACCIALGLWYRVATALFFLGFTYVFLLEKAHYLNHFYLISLVSFLLIFVPAHRAWSIDVASGAVRRSATMPNWALWLLRGQMAIVYVLGGVAKLNGDWLRGEPIRAWLAQRSDFPLIGRWFGEEWMVWTFAYGGLLFDLLIVPLLLWRRTRLVAFLMLLMFHLTNSLLFQIGVFPWFAIAASLLFFPPETPRLVARRLLSLVAGPARRSVAEDPRPIAALPNRLTTGQVTTVALVLAFLTFQVLLPLRHVLYPGNVSWTEEGHRFAWHMKLRSKGGDIRFFATDPTTGRTWEIEPREYLTSLQLGKMATHPDMILQFAHFLRDELAREGVHGVEIRVIALASLNGRPRQLLIDPTVDLAALDHSISPAAWIVPLVTDLDAVAPPPLDPAHEEAIEALLLAVEPEGEGGAVANERRHALQNISLRQEETKAED